MRITAHARGGLAVYGPGRYDPSRNEAIVYSREGETIPCEIEYPSAPSSMTKTESGITSTTPSITGSVASLTLSSIQTGGYVDIKATVSGGVRKIRIVGGVQTDLDGYGD